MPYIVGLDTSVRSIFLISITSDLSGRLSQLIPKQLYHIHTEKDTLLKVADYAENEKDILMKRVRIISFVGLGSLLLALLFVSFEIEQINLFLMCIEGIAFGLSVGALITCIFFTTGVLSEIRNKIRNNKKSKCVVTALRVIFTAIVIICIMVCLIMTVLNK